MSFKSQKPTGLKKRNLDESSLNLDDKQSKKQKLDQNNENMIEKLVQMNVTLAENMNIILKMQSEKSLNKSMPQQ